MNEGLNKQEELEISVEVAKPEDWQAYRDIRIEAVTKNPEAFGRTLEETWAKTDEDWQDDLLDEGRLYVFAKKDGSATGAVSMAGSFKADKKVWRVIAVYTRPEFRGQGLSEKVIKKILEEIKRRGGMKAILNVTDLPQQEAARALYKKLGFVECEPKHAKDAFVLEMEKDLGAETSQ